VNREEHLLTCLAEECGEVQQAISKALRFGLNETVDDYLKYLGDTTVTSKPSNRERIIRELADVLAVVELLDESGVLTTNEICNRNLIEEKKKKLKHFMEYARSRGTLKDWQ
jgi:NTP pyrophosphatase (non-canonical NTP hydrolase)